MKTKNQYGEAGCGGGTPPESDPERLWLSSPVTKESIAV